MIKATFVKSGKLGIHFQRLHSCFSAYSPLALHPGGPKSPLSVCGVVFSKDRTSNLWNSTLQDLPFKVLAASPLLYFDFLQFFSISTYTFI